MTVVIRPLVKEDANISYKWRNNPEIWKYTGSRPDREITLDIELEWIENVLLRENEKRFAILVDNVYVGNTQLTSITDESAVFHIFIGDTKYWGKGVASKAMDLLMNFAKNELNLEKLILTVNQENKSAVNLYKRKGFVSVGIETKNSFLKMEKKL